VEHLVSGCSLLADQQYKSRHDHITRHIHWLLCQKYSIECCALWWQYIPVCIIDINLVKILWDLNIYYDRVISARQPDITIIDKTAKLITLVDISVPSDKRVVNKED